MKDMDTRLTARVVAADIATGHRSVSDVVQATLDRIDVMEPQVQAFVHLDPALVRARAQDVHANEMLPPPVVASSSVGAASSPRSLRRLPLAGAARRHKSGGNIYPCVACPF